MLFRSAIAAFAKHNGYVIASEYFDAAVSGADPIDDRPGFKALIERIASNGVRTVIVEDASRFARTLMVQEAGIAILVSMGVRVLTSRGDDLTDSLSLRKISAELAKAGHLNEQGRPYNPKSVLTLINGPRPKSGAPAGR